MNKNQRMLWSDKLMDLANLGAAGLIFGSFLSGRNIAETRWDLVIIGIIIYVIIAVISHVLRR